MYVQHPVDSGRQSKHYSDVLVKVVSII